MEESKAELTRQARKQIRIAISSFVVGVMLMIALIWNDPMYGWTVGGLVGGIGLAISVNAIKKWDGLARRRDRAD